MNFIAYNVQSKLLPDLVLGKTIFKKIQKFLCEFHTLHMQARPTLYQPPTYTLNSAAIVMLHERPILKPKPVTGFWISEYINLQLRLYFPLKFLIL